jgi:hypothetical protein
VRDRLLLVEDAERFAIRASTRDIFAQQGPSLLGPAQE